MSYVGPLDRVYVVLPGPREVDCARDATIEVPDELGASLIEQDTWVKKAEPKPAAPKRAAEAKEDN